MRLTSITLTTLLLVTGCATMVEMRDEGPYRSLTSTKTPEVIANCVSEAWTTQQVTPIAFTPDVRINPITGGKQVMIYNSQSLSPDAFVDIVGNAPTKLTYYAKHRELFKRGYADLVSGCI